tara:strand:+ start:6243 stop:6902 length:660 start_codon:yes stop_codon:yes gene_type:complete
MYYPKSQIQTELFTNGEDFTIFPTDERYSGYYFITGDNQAFTGKNPNDKPNLQLIPTTNRYSSTSTPLIISDPKPTTNTGEYIVDPLYNISRKNPITEFQVPPLSPIQTYPRPKESDYNVGEIQRYFVKKINSIKYIEINKTNYTRYLNNESTVNWQLYAPFSLPWEITGDRSKVYEVNKKTVSRITNNLNLIGFKSYFKDKYDQFHKNPDKKTRLPLK